MKFKTKNVKEFPGGFRWSEQAPFTSVIVYYSRCEIMTLVSTVSQRSTESRGFSPGIPVFSHRGNVDRVTARGAFRKPSTVELRPLQFSSALSCK